MPLCTKGKRKEAALASFEMNSTACMHAGADKPFSQMSCSVYTDSLPPNLQYMLRVYILKAVTGSQNFPSVICPILVFLFCWHSASVSF